VADQTIAGRYNLIERLDAGGAHEVWRAEDSRLGRPVAVKILRAAYVNEPGYLERFTAEAGAAARLDDPHVVSLYDSGREADFYYLIMEYVPGATLKQMLDERGAVRPLEAVEIALAMASALEHAHSAGVLHRNLRPEYVLIEPDGDVKLSDFGIARQAAGSGVEAAPPAGDARYISPEQAQGQPTGPATDVYGLGVVLYQMLAGRPPFLGDSAAEVAGKHVNEMPVPPSQVAPAVGEHLDAIVLKAMAKAPAERYPSVADMAAELEMAAAEITVHYKRRRTWIWVASSAALLLAIAAVIFAVTALRASTVAVPPVIGLSAAEASGTVIRDRLSPVFVTTPSPTAAAGIVIGEIPSAGKQVKPASTVQLTVSSGPAKVTVPSYVGLTLGAVLPKIPADRLVAGTITKQNSNTFPAQTVMAQTPPEGTLVSQGTTVSLTVSAGQARAAVPDVTGLTQAGAQSQLRKGKFRVSAAQRYSSQPAGTVISQSPSAGNVVAAGSMITIYVSRGLRQVTVPDVTDSTQFEATAELQGLGLQVITASRATSDTARVGVVLSQDPSGGEIVPTGSAVKIVVGRSP
jgi:eukaryotic-like serine/threonine-protein kinase